MVSSHLRPHHLSTKCLHKTIWLLEDVNFLCGWSNFLSKRSFWSSTAHRNHELVFSDDKILLFSGMGFKIEKTQTDSRDSDLIRWWGVGMFISHWYLEREWFHQHTATLAGFIALEQPLDCNLFTRGSDTGHAYMAPTLRSYGWASKETFVKLASSFCNRMINLDNANYLQKSA